MNSFLKYTLYTLGGFIVAVALFSGWYFWNAGGFKDLKPRFAGSCNPVVGEGSAEDLIIDRDTNLVYISAFDRLGSQSQKGLLGTISIYDLSSGAGRFEMTEMAEPTGLHPHGISLYKDENGNKRLFVISHLAEEDVIELFDIAEDGSLIYVETIRGPLLVSANGIAAVGPRSFYIANDSGALEGAGQFIDMTFGTGSVPFTYYDGTNMRSVADAPTAGGIAVSADGSQLYLAATSQKRVLIYDRDVQTGDVTLRTSVDLNTGVDNVRVAEDGALWVAGHANTIALVGHFTSGGKDPAPTQIFRIPILNGDPGDPEEIYVNGGEEISAGSVAAVHNGQMLVGSITAKKFLICDFD